jgi:hypothetical protein
VTERLFEACDPDRAFATQGLGCGQLFGPLREEQLVLSASNAFSSAQNLFHGFLSRNLMAADPVPFRLRNRWAATKKAAGGASAASEGIGSYEDFTRREAA